MTTEGDFMNRDLPEETDFEDAFGTYGTQFGILWLSDDACEWPKLLELYRHADKSGRQLINDVFLYLVGYTLPTIVDQAHTTTTS